MIIRKATKSDTEQIIDMFYRMYNEAGRAKYGGVLDHESIRQSVLQYIMGFVAYVMDYEGIIAGFIFGIVCPAPWNVTELFMYEMNWYVESKYRGYSVKLLQKLEEYAKEIGVKYIVAGNTDVGKTDRFEKFYLKKGYKLFEQSFIKEI